jgi:23S rRNA (uracil1939-C5)-methyltransferase
MEDKVYCEHAARCAGCPQIDHVYSEQLAFKTARVVTAFARYPMLKDVRIENARGTAARVGYRTRAKLVGGKNAALGLFAKGAAHEVVDIPSCRVMSDEVKSAVATIRAWLALPSVPSLRTIADGGRISAIDAREVRDENQVSVIVTLILRKPSMLSESELAALEALAARETNICSLAVSFVDANAIQLLGRELRVIHGPSSVRDRIGLGSVYQLATHGSFVQAHREQTEAIHERIVIALRAALHELDGKRILDLYAGSGALGLQLADTGARILLVESYEPAVEQARAAAQEQGLQDVHVYAGDVADVAHELVTADVEVDAVIVNPPRRGVARAARAAIANLAPAVIVYVSCHPETLARDLADFARMGFSTSAASPFDMIPLTDEVETLVVLHKTNIPAPTVLYENKEIIVVDKAPNEPTTPQGEHAHCLLARVQRIKGCAKAAPIHRLDEGTSGVCIFAKETRFVSKWSDALQAETAVKKYIALVRGSIRATGTVDRPLTDDGRTREASTRYELVETVSHHSLVAAYPNEGRTHQIRRHFAAIDHPILGDSRYGDAASNRHLVERHGLDRAFLHCQQITLTHPDTRTTITFEAVLSGDLQAVLASLAAR